MKMKSIFAVALAALAFVACSKDEGVKKNASEMGYFEVVLPGASDTKAVEDIQVAGAVTPEYADVATYLVDNGGNYVLHTWTDDEIKAKAKRFEQIVAPAKVVVIANKGNVTLPATTTETALATVMNGLAIADQNKGVANVTLKGECASTAFTTEAKDDTHELVKASVELKSLVSRFEVGTVKAGTGLESISVEAVYINNFYNSYVMEADDATQYTEGTFADPYNPTWATDGASTDVTSVAGTKCYAYQVFTGDMVPHIIYKVSGKVDADHKLADGTEGAFTGKFITVKGFMVDTNKKLVGTTAGANEYQMKANEIYKMGLTDSGIEITPEEITDKPEKSKTDLIVAVTVAAWTEQTVTPEI